MPNPTRKEIFEQAAARLRADFQELVVVPHSGEKGGEAEGLLRNFLAERLPHRFDVGAGFIIDPNDKISQQTDVIIYDALNCPVYRASDRASIYPADNVAAVVEVKSRLDGRELRRAFENIESTKSLAKHPPDPPLHAQTFGCIFAFESDLSRATLLKQYVECIRDFGFLLHPDMLVVLDMGAITITARHPAMDSWNMVTAIEGFGGAQGEGSHFAAAYHDTRSATLDFFFRMLLTSLNTFRPFQDLDPFGALSEKVSELAYLFSHTNETEPKKREELLKRYAREARKYFTQVPGTDEVIHLGAGKDEGER
jgi:hypothetical protein